LSHRALVSFVGAGPGDPDLITVKGLRRLRDADVVIHDRLVPLALLDDARADAEVLDVGKAPGQPCLAQEQIHRLIIDRASRGARVVRLKGGDPTLFGRLGEEIRAVRAAGIAFEIVPGVTAATAAAAVAGISLTERGSASAVIFATGTDHRGRQPAALDWNALARADGTLVFYMAVGGLDALLTTLIESGRDPGEAAMIVERTGTEGQRVLTGRLRDMAALACRARVKPPAVLIIGPTIAAAARPPAEPPVLVAEEA
jgi:uroporphyrin-III C-methyltransferase